MANLSNLARMHTSTVGSGSFVTLTTASDGCLTFIQSGMTDGLTYSYGIVDGSGAETGRGVFNASGSKITRSPLNSTNSGSLIVLSGNAEIYVTALAQDFQIPYSGNDPPIGNYVGQLWWDTDDPTLSAQGPQGVPGASGLLTTVEVDLGSYPRSNGKFYITSAGLTIGKPVLIQQASGSYTGKGTRTDEAEMDGLTVTGKVTSASSIECFWSSRNRVRKNFKFDYFVSA